jgi:hypothetical protein
MTSLAKPFFRVKYFDRGQREEAWRWLMQPVERADGYGPLDAISGFVRRNPVMSLIIAGVLLALLVSQFGTSRPMRSNSSPY